VPISMLGFHSWAWPPGPLRFQRLGVCASAKLFRRLAHFRKGPGSPQPNCVCLCVPMDMPLLYIGHHRVPPEASCSLLLNLQEFLSPPFMALPCSMLETVSQHSLHVDCLHILPTSLSPLFT
jgi:hypothetical protein